MINLRRSAGGAHRSTPDRQLDSRLPCSRANQPSPCLAGLRCALMSHMTSSSPSSSGTAVGTRPSTGAQRRLGPSFRTIPVSRYGYLGSSLPPDASTAGQADALAALLDHLDIDQVNVVSLSAGSTAAALPAIRHPDRTSRLVLESAVLPTTKPTRLPPTCLLKLLLRTEWPTSWTSTKPSVVARASGTRWTDLDPDSRVELAAIMSTLLPVGPRRPGMIFDNVATGPEMLRDEIPWEQITAPTLVVTAQDSPLPRPADAATVVDRLPQGDLLVMPRGGHLLLVNVETLRKAMRVFLIDDERPAASWP